MRNLLKSESTFAATMALYASDDLSPEQKKEVEQLFTMDHGGIVAACNRYMERLCKAIEKKKMSLKGFTTEDAAKFKMLLDNDKLSEELRDRLNHLLYGGDEHVKYFDE